MDDYRYYKYMYMKMFNTVETVREKLFDLSIVLQQVSIELRAVQQECAGISVKARGKQDTSCESGEEQKFPQCERGDDCLPV